MKNERKDYIVVGAALFAMFFGAGNLIFPPALGMLSGDQWLSCILGFALTGVGLPILGVITIAKVGGSLKDFAGRVSPLFATVLGAVIVLAIGPLLAIPRTGATVFEIGISPLFPTIPPLAVSIVYFTITLFFVIKPSSIIDKIGKILTPILLLIVGLIIFKGVASPIGAPVPTGIKLAFSEGFVGGYQTMDALASVVLGGLILFGLKEKGYTDQKSLIKLTSKAGILAGSALLFIYGGLLFLGATGSGLLSAELTKTELIIELTNRVLGIYGQMGICLAVSVACLTTSIGLTAVVGNFFEELTKGKLSYRTIVIATTLFSIVMSVIGVEQIVKLSVPLLVLVYPVTIVLIALNLFGKHIKSDMVFKSMVVGTLFISVFDALGAMGINIEAMTSIISKLPFASAGFAWICPAILCGFVGHLIGKVSPNKEGTLENIPQV
ncbi:MAG: branched-chain amino acid transport system II carrier protein [Clostridia bacterium]|nr:branched-chain amino acid transport system II carrier protein [Clostridia bacterium]